jgi:hypothetical protein
MLAQRRAYLAQLRERVRRQHELAPVSEGLNPPCERGEASTGDCAPARMEVAGARDGGAVCIRDRAGDSSRIIDLAKSESESTGNVVNRVSQLARSSTKIDAPARLPLGPSRQPNVDAQNRLPGEDRLRLPGRFSAEKHWDRHTLELALE